MNNKNKLLSIAFLCFCFNSIAQQTPTGSAPNANLTPPPVLAQQAWYKGGNSATGTNPLNNLFGTMWNSPIYTVTNGANRQN